MEYDFRLYEPVKVRIEVVDRNVRVLIDDQQRMFARTSFELDGGIVRFESPNTSVLFDNVHIYSLGE
jgi:hypothetical protein